MPFYASIPLVILLPLLVFLSHVILIVLVGVETIDEYGIDKLVHVAGGCTISISIAGIWWHLVYRQIVVLKDAIVFRALIFGSLCFVVISST